MTQAADLPMQDFPRQRALPSGLFFSIALGVSTLLWLVVVGQMVFIVPGFKRMFADFGMKAPIMTDLVMHDLWWLAPLFAVGAFSISMLTRSRWVWILLLIVLPLLVNGLVAVSLYLPYQALLDGLGGNAPRP
jgi:hypothetical protein